MKDYKNLIVAISVGLLLAGIFLPYIVYFDTYTNPNPTIQTLMRTGFPIFMILGGLLSVYKLKHRN
ncbi:MAG: hypothetical protein ACFFKA_05795 [Candidatus Thorarchaeota archaeon]